MAVRRGARGAAYTFTQASTDAEKKAAADQVQANALQVVTHIPLGEWRGFGAARETIGNPTPLPPIMVFWGVTNK